MQHKSISVLDQNIIVHTERKKNAEKIQILLSPLVPPKPF